MKLIYGDQQPSSPEASTSSGSSKYDQERGSLPTTITSARTVDVLISNSPFPCFPSETKLDLLRQVLAEGVGTFILMFCICAIIAITALMKGEVGLMEYSTTAAFSIVVVIFSIGAISGAHVNPAVTIAFAVTRQFPCSKVPLYILAQTTGAVLATFAGKLVYGTKAELMLTQPLQGAGSAFWVELIASFILVFLAAALTYQAKYIAHIAGFVVGIAIGLAVLITAPISGGSMNPARSLGPAIVSWKFDHLWIYLVAPTLGAIGGAFLFQGLHLRNHACCLTAPPPLALNNSNTSRLVQPLRIHGRDQSQLSYD